MTTKNKTIIKKTNKITKQNKLIGVRVSAQMYNYLLESAKKQRRTVSNYVRNILEEQVDTTEYLLSSPANAKILMESIAEAEQGNLVTFDKPQDILDYAQTLSN